MLYNAGRAAAAAAPSTAAGRKLKQVTVFFETPDVAGSATTDISANAGVRWWLRLSGASQPVLENLSACT